MPTRRKSTIAGAKAKNEAIVLAFSYSIVSSATSIGPGESSWQSDDVDCDGLISMVDDE